MNLPLEIINIIITMISHSCEKKTLKKIFYVCNEWRLIATKQCVKFNTFKKVLYQMIYDGDLKGLKHLYNNNPHFPVDNMNEYYRLVCNTNFVKVAQWFESIPNCEIQYHKNDFIQKYVRVGYHGYNFKMLKHIINKYNLTFNDVKYQFDLAHLYNYDNWFITKFNLTRDVILDTNAFFCSMSNLNNLKRFVKNITYQKEILLIKNIMNLLIMQ